MDGCTDGFDCCWLIGYCIGLALLVAFLNACEDDKRQREEARGTRFSSWEAWLHFLGYAFVVVVLPTVGTIVSLAALAFVLPYMADRHPAIMVVVCVVSLIVMNRTDGR